MSSNSTSNDFDVDLKSEGVDGIGIMSPPSSQLLDADENVKMKEKEGEQIVI